MDALTRDSDAFTPLTSARIAGTRVGSGQPNAGQTLAAGGTLTVQAAGRGGVPENAQSVVVNLSVPANNTTGYMVAHPFGTNPQTSSLFHVTGAEAFNQVTVKLSPTGTFSIYNYGGTADVVIDVMGSYGPLATYTYNGDGCGIRDRPLPVSSSSPGTPAAAFTHPHRRHRQASRTTRSLQSVTDTTNKGPGQGSACDANSPYAA